MHLRGIFAIALCLGLSPAAITGEASAILHSASCSVVRFYVTKYSAPVAEQWARSKGATEAEIEAARRCCKARVAVGDQKRRDQPATLARYPCVGFLRHVDREYFKLTC